MKNYLSKIETPTDSYVPHYHWAIDMAIQQQSLFWPAEELGVDEDEQDFRTKLTPGELNGILTAQSILTQYELMIGGEELWGGKIAKMFPRPEIQRMCACFSNVELGSHAPFYALGNEVLGKATDEFYTQWKQDPVLTERIRFITECAASDDALEVTAALALLEGAVLFTVLGYFKGFNSRGFNFIPHFVSGIDGSTKDENFHSIASANLFRQCKAERMAAGNHSTRRDNILKAKIVKMVEHIREHELYIIDKLYAVGKNRVVKKEELVDFLDDRLNIVLKRLEMEPMFEKNQGVISGWFYQQLSTVKVPDFFAATQLQYTRNWAKHKLAFRRDLLNVD
jgi:ribonucleotide reductase beta subunit family protein with ferritin-like domain